MASDKKHKTKKKAASTTKIGGMTKDPKKKRPTRR